MSANRKYHSLEQQSLQPFTHDAGYKHGQRLGDSLTSSPKNDKRPI